MIFSMMISLFKISFWKLLFLNRIKVSPIQSFHMSFKINSYRKGKIQIGKGMKCRRGCSLISDSGQLVIGNNVFMNQNVMITCEKSIIIEDLVTIANNVVIVDHDHDYVKDVNQETSFVTDDVFIGQNTWIGANVVILKGTHIGKDCVVAAGTIVRKGTYPDKSVIYDKRDTICIERRV